MNAIEFLTIDGLVLVGFLGAFGYTAISSFENPICGIWKESDVIQYRELDRPIFYKHGVQLQ